MNYAILLCPLISSPYHCVIKIRTTHRKGPCHGAGVQWGHGFGAGPVHAEFVICMNVQLDVKIYSFILETQ
jgi:hypothetical protein